MSINNITVSLINAMTKIMGLLYDEITSNLNRGRYPQQLKNGVTNLPLEVTQKSVKGTIKIQAPQVLAFEYGSGLHSTQGPKAKYIIPPKTKKALAFEWEPEQEPWGSPKFIGKSADGRYIFKYVEHPGIAAKPFVEPAIKAKEDEILEIAAKELVDGISAFLGPDVEVIVV